MTNTPIEVETESRVAGTPEKEATIESAITLTLFGRTVVGTTRGHDEDAFLISNLVDAVPIQQMTSPVSLDVAGRGVLIAVSDGMGGAQAGEVASSLVLSSLWHGMSSARASSAGAALRGTIEDSNQRVFDTAKATGRVGMGATLTAMLFSGAYVYIAEIGDSRAYLLRGGAIVQLTRDQTYVQELIDKGGISREEAEDSELSHVILQAMGLKTDVEVVLNRISVRRNDRFLVCSDGLSGPLTDRQIQAIVVGSESLSSACAQLIEAAIDNGGEDDITVVLAEVDGDGAPTMTADERFSLETTQQMAPVLDAPASAPTRR